MGFLAALFLLGFLIFIHELGHFTFAKLFNVRVEAFSIGFGPKVLGFKVGETEYKISAVPLGGYVKLLGEATDDFDLPLPPDLKNRSLNAQPYWKKSLILLAGPVTNLLFPLVIFFGIGLFSLAEPTESLTVGTVYGEPALAAGIQPGDRITAIDGKAVDEWGDIQNLVMPKAGKKIRVDVVREGKPASLTVVPEAAPAMTALREKITIGRIGIVPDFDPPVLGVPAGSFARQVGLMTGDRVHKVDGLAVDTWIDFQKAMEQRAGRAAVLNLTRFPGPDQRMDQPGMPVIVTVVVPSDNPLLGMNPPSTYVGAVDPDTDLGAKLKPGDRLLSMDGEVVRHYYGFISKLAALEDRECTIMVEREGQDEGQPSAATQNQPLLVRGGLTKKERTGPYKDLGPMYLSGVDWMVGPDEPVRDMVAVDRSPLEYIAYPVEKTWEVTYLGVKSIYLLVTGQVSVKQMGGPIMIVDVARRAYQASWLSYLNTMALISISLGILNLLPIPMLDGGQLFFNTLEAARRQELSRRFKERANMVGFFLLIALMMLVFKNDIERYWESIMGLFAG